MITSEAVNALAQAIDTKERQFIECRKIMKEHELTYRYLHELDGMKAAFQIITGESYIDYFIRQIEEAQEQQNPVIDSTTANMIQ